MTDNEFFDMMKKEGKRYFSDNTTPFKEYIDRPEGKFVIAISKSQYVIKAAFYGDHALMAADMIRVMRPDLKIDGWGNAINRDEDFRDHNVFLFGYKNYTLLCLPNRELLSLEQFENIKEILLNIKDHNSSIKNPYVNKWELLVDDNRLIRIDGPKNETDIDSIIEQLEKYITDDYIKTDEVIIGKSISKNKSL